MTGAQQVVLAGVIIAVAALSSVYAHDVNCATITGCSQCIPVAYNATEAALRFNAIRTQRTKQRAEKQIQRAQTQLAKMPGGAAAGPAARATKGRLLRAVESVDVSEITDVTIVEVQSLGDKVPKDIEIVPSCMACAEGYSLVTKSVRGRPPMGRCECAAGYGIQYNTFTATNKKGQTKIRKNFTCTKCEGNSVPLTPAAGLKITNAGVVIVTAPVNVDAVEAAGKTVARNNWLPARAAKRFDLVPGQCVECPLGSVKSADGISCEPTASN